MKIKNKSTKFNFSCCHFEMDGKEYENIYNFVNGDYKVYPTEFSENDKGSFIYLFINYLLTTCELKAQFVNFIVLNLMYLNEMNF